MPSGVSWGRSAWSLLTSAKKVSTAPRRPGVEPAARVPDHVHRTLASHGLADRLEHTHRPLRQGGGGMGPHHVDLRTDAEGPRAPLQKVDDVGEVLDLAQVREPEEARDEVDVMAAAHQSRAATSPGTPTPWMCSALVPSS